MLFNRRAYGITF